MNTTTFEVWSVGTPGYSVDRQMQTVYTIEEAKAVKAAWEAPTRTRNSFKAFIVKVTKEKIE